MPSVERVRWAKFRTSAVSLVALLILGILVYLLSGGTFLEPKANVYMYLSDATGLGPGSPVRVGGITVGEVKAIALSGSNEPGKVVKVTIEVPVKNLATIPADSRAELSTETLIGDKYVDISPGLSAERLRPGGEIAFHEPADMLKKLDIQQLETRMRKIDEDLAGIEQGTSRVGKFVQGEDVYRNFLEQIGKIEDSLRQAAGTTSRLGQMLNTDLPLRRISEPLLELDQGLARLYSGQGSMGQFLRDPAQYEKLRADLRNVRGAVVEIGSREFLQSDRMYESWTRSVVSIIQAVDQFNAGPAFGVTATYDNLNGAARQLRDTMKDFRENPSKYLRLNVF